MRREKLNIVGLLFFVVLISSCASLRRGKTGGDRIDGSFDSRRFFEDVKKQNITSKDFRFDKVRVDAEINGERVKFSGNLKYSTSGVLLLSVRTIGNIEIARLYIDKENVILIDRINREYNIGITQGFLQKYGLTWNDIIVLFGDYPAVITTGNRIKCVDGIAETETVKGGIKAIISFDCENRKMSKIITNPDGSLSERFISEYSEFRSEGGINYPGSIKVTGGGGKVNFDIGMEKYREFEGEITPPTRPSGYTIINIK